MTGNLNAIIGAYPTPSKQSFDGLGVITTTGQSSVSFTNIPTNYIAIQLRYSYIPSDNAGYPKVLINNNTSSGYTYNIGFVSNNFTKYDMLRVDNGSPSTLLVSYPNLSTTKPVSGIIDIYDYNLRENTTSPSARYTTGVIGATASSWELSQAGGSYFAFPFRNSRVQSLGIILNAGTMASAVSFALYGVKG